MTVYIVERSLPGLTVRHWSALQYALSEASRRLSASGSPVRYLGTTFVPARSRCFCLFEAASLELVKAANDAALVPYVSIHEAIDLRTADSRSSQERGS